MIDFSSPTQISKQVGIFDCDVCGDSPDQKCGYNETCTKSHENEHGFVCAKCSKEEGCNDNTKKDLCKSALNKFL